LRLALLAGGSEPAGAEAARMVSEKMCAALEGPAGRRSCRYDWQRRTDSGANSGDIAPKDRANRNRLGAAKTPATSLTVTVSLSGVWMPCFFSCSTWAAQSLIPESFDHLCH